MLSSMTGFGAESGERDGQSWNFEIKSVNGRGLDIRLHLPQGSFALEVAIRAEIKAQLSRGNVQASLSVRDQRDRLGLALNTPLLTALARRARLLDRQSGRSVGSAGVELISMKGVISGDKPASDSIMDEATIEDILTTVRSALEKLKEARQSEGAALKTVLQRIVSDMGDIVVQAQSTADIQPAQIKSRLETRLSELLSDQQLNDDRLEQEVALLVTKADVTEELDRLSAHLEEAGQLVASDKPVGRKLDFLSQELLREANTLGSKSASLEMTRHSLSLKSLIDQFKEQAANVE